MKSHCLIRSLVGKSEQRWRHGEAESLRGLEIDHEPARVMVLKEKRIDGRKKS